MSKLLGSENKPVLMTSKKNGGRRTGVYLGGNKQYAENWDKIFGKKEKSRRVDLLGNEIQTKE
jgi:hypothetical protein